MEKKDSFYSELENVLDIIHNTGVLVILKYLNAKIRKEIIFKPTIGYHSLHEITSNNGFSLIDLAKSRC